MIVRSGGSARATRAPRWSRSRRKAIGAGDTFEGAVRATAGGAYTIGLNDGRVIEASLRGRLKRSPGRVVIGDRVEVREGPDAWTIESVEDRKSTLARRGQSVRTAKILAANLDLVFGVVSLGDPPATTELIDRLLVLIASSGARAVLVLNKADLPGADERARPLVELYRGLGYVVLLASAKRGDGLPELHDAMSGSFSALIGPSGVGKSSLLNALDPELRLRTGELSGKGATGRHTTVGSRVLELRGGAMVADTPGFSDVGVWGVAPEELQPCFPEIDALADGCRFRGCRHLEEPDCAVREALSEGAIPATRYRSYVKLRSEAEVSR